MTECYCAEKGEGKFGMKLLVLNASPKRNESDTMHLTRAFLEGMNQAGLAYASTRAISDETRARLAVPMIPEEEYARIVNGGL